MRNLFIIFILMLPVMVLSQEQTQKGKWLINHSIGGIRYINTSTKSYNSGGVLTTHSKNTNFGLSLSFISPNWGAVNAIQGTNTNVLNDQKQTTNSFGITLQPVAGKFIKNNLMIGASVYLSAGSSVSEGSGNSDVKFRNFGLGAGPVIRYYLGDKVKIKPFVGFESRFAHINTKQENNSTSGVTTYKDISKQKGNEIQVNPYAGYAWFLGKKWSLELQLEYKYTSYKSENTSERYVNNVMAMGYPLTSESKQISHTVSLSAGVAVSL